jgi:hypothetical protein
MKGHGALLSDDGPIESYSGLEVRFAEVTTDLREPRFWIVLQFANCRANGQRPGSVEVAQVSPSDTHLESPRLVNSPNAERDRRVLNTRIIRS